MRRMINLGGRRSTISPECFRQKKIGGHECGAHIGEKCARRVVRQRGAGVMTAISSAAELQRWLVDYLITNVGCNAGDLDFDVSFADVGVGSRDAVVLSGE